MSYTNGYQNGNGNGNGKQSPFILAQPKTPEEIEQEKIRGMMPELRRNCSRDRRLKNWVGAKWLYGQISDLSFLHTFGGNGHGIVHLSVKDLSRIYGHHKDSISKWRDKLIDTGWIWYIDSWPKSQWGIAGICRQPELFATHVDYIRTVAKADTRPTEQAGRAAEGKTQDLGQNGPQSQPDRPTEQATPAYGVGHTGLRRRLERPAPSHTIGPQRRPDRPTEQATPAYEVAHTGLSSHPLPAYGTGSLKETPIGDRSKGADQGTASPPKERVEWEKKLRKMFDRELRQVKADLVEQRKHATDDAERDDLTGRIALVETYLYGAPKKRGAARSASSSVAARIAPEKPLTAAELARTKKLVADLRKAVA